MRVSDDMDLAVAVELDEFPGALASNSEWRPDPKVEHRFYFRDALPMDVLPAHGAALAQGFIDWPSGARMSLVGFDLAFPISKRAEARRMKRSSAIRVERRRSHPET
jgi:predicted nucleotidyltransferase